MNLTELFDRQIPYEVCEQTGRLYQEIAIISNREIVFGAEQFHSAGAKAWEIYFLEKQNHPDQAPMSMRITGSGGELRVFAFVKAALNRFIAKYSPTSFLFSAALDEPSRVSLYTMFVKHFKAFGYQVETQDNNGARNWIFTEQFRLFESTQFRKIVHADITRVLEIEAAFKDSPWKRPESFMKYDTILMIYDDKIIGYFITKPGDNGNTVLVKMAIDPALQGKGYGSEMMKKLKSMHSKLELDVRANNVSAISMYKKFGFKQTDIRKSYYKNGDDAIYMTLN